MERGFGGVEKSKGKRHEGMDWIDLAKYKDRWRALVNAVMNLRVPYKAGNFVTG